LYSPLFSNRLDDALSGDSLDNARMEPKPFETAKRWQSALQTVQSSDWKRYAYSSWSGREKSPKADMLRTGGACAKNGRGTKHALPGQMMRKQPKDKSACGARLDVYLMLEKHTVRKIFEII
jgi:hypothetical protein